MPWPNRYDNNWGRCTFAGCNLLQTARCDGFACLGCCKKGHGSWANHYHPHDVDAPVDSRLPAHYGGNDTKVVIEYDYSAGPKEGTAVELSDDYQRVFVPLSNFRANKDWPADYIG